MLSKNNILSISNAKHATKGFFLSLRKTVVTLTSRIDPDFERSNVSLKET